jgi:hypothetical protein
MMINARQHIHHAHERHDLLGHLGDGFQAAHNHREHDPAKMMPVIQPGIITHDLGQLRMGLVGLEHVAAAQSAQDAEDREHHRKELAGMGMPRSAKPLVR